ncbi:hypothetical protein CXB51_022553 [Gossypium anomalum]|uniref:Uncharacterized protein n=1 Tax=Gossypium anomalum TaxID=47600 RepID=A0A8J6CUY9_9ROSI|nr:hypothetical protein CXB51_022553 [Gossypium anomalum]
MIYGGQIEIAWLRRNFATLDEDSTKIERERYARAYILQIIEVILMSNKLRNLVNLRWLLKLIDFRGVSELSWRWNHGPSYVGLPTKLQDIWLLLDQRSKVEFEWTPYEDPAIQEVILEEFFVNPNIWHMKVSLVVYITIEMHETNRVL